MDITDPATFVRPPAERYAAEHYATARDRHLHARGTHPEDCSCPVHPAACLCDRCRRAEAERALDDDADAYFDRLED